MATSVGLPNVIAHGMYTMALAIRVVTDWAGDPGAVIDYGVRFTRPIAVSDPEGATLTVAGNQGDVVLTAAADPETGFGAAPGSAIDPGNIHIQARRGEQS